MPDVAIKLNSVENSNEEKSGTPLGIELPEELINGYKELNEKMDATIIKIQKKRLQKKE